MFTVKYPNYSFFFSLSFSLLFYFVKCFKSLKLEFNFDILSMYYIEIQLCIVMLTKIFDLHLLCTLKVSHIYSNILDDNINFFTLKIYQNQSLKIR